MAIKILKKRAYSNMLEEINFLKIQVEESVATIENFTNRDFTIQKYSSIQTQISKSLQNLQKNLVSLNQKEIQNKWLSDGFALFSELEKRYSEDIQVYLKHFNKSLVDYIGANQVGVYKLKQDFDSNILELVSSFAIEKTKSINKLINIGEGLVGQCFLDKETISLDSMPENYTKISSGLGESLPAHLLIIPAKVLDEVYGVIEIASFNKFSPAQIRFIEQIIASVAYAFKNFDSKNKTLLLLKESQMLSEDLRSRDEEMRQNLEEMSATQEEMMRKQIEIDNQRNLLSLIIDSIPFPIFIKDKDGFYTMINAAQANIFGLGKENIIGKKDDDFITNKDELNQIKSSDYQVISSKKEIELPLQNFSTRDGKNYVFKTTKIPFINSITKNVDIFGVSVDITEKITIEKRIHNEKKLALNNYTIDLAGRQRMLSQKIAFLSLQVTKGNLLKIESLKNAVELFDHSFYTLKNGGTPQNMSYEQKIEAAKEEFLPVLNIIEEIWNGIKKCAFEIMEPNNENKTAIDYIENNSEKLLEVSDKLVKALSESSKNNVLNNL